MSNKDAIMKLCPIKCVIFDCEGTLVDSETLCCQVLVELFSHFGAHLDYQECLIHFDGGQLAHILETTQQRLGLSISLDILEPMYRDIAHRLFTQRLKMMPGARSVTHFLHYHHIEFCIASNSTKEKVKHVLALTGLSELFGERIFSAFDANSWKPEPDLLLYCAMNMGFLPHECIYIDDTVKGVEAGHRAGIETYQLCHQQTRTNIHPEVNVIHQLVELIPIICAANSVPEESAFQ